MRIMAIDFGEKRIGIAMSDPLGITAQPVTVLQKADTFEGDIEGISGVIKEYQEVSKIVVGMPKTLKGEVGIAGQKVQEFVGVLKKHINIPVVLWDERLTTAAAEKMLISAGLSRKKRKKVIDKTAAAYILQSYLDSKK